MDIAMERNGAGAVISLQVDAEANLINAYVSSKVPGRVELQKVGNLKDVKELPIAGMADVKLGSNGAILWAFEDAESPLEINPFALVQTDRDVRSSAISDCLCFGQFSFEESDVLLAQLPGNPSYERCRRKLRLVYFDVV
jgi:hypothetical protein